MYQPYADEPRLTVSSVLLLAVFVGAVAVVIAAFVWQPWDGDEPGEPSSGGQALEADTGGDGPDIIVQPAE